MECTFSKSSSLILTCDARPPSPTMLSDGRQARRLDGDHVDDDGGNGTSSFRARGIRLLASTDKPSLSPPRRENLVPTPFSVGLGSPWIEVVAGPR